MEQLRVATVDITSGFVLTLALTLATPWRDILARDKCDNETQCRYYQAHDDSPKPNRYPNG
jgi:hypothetical protein